MQQLRAGCITCPGDNIYDFFCWKAVGCILLAEVGPEWFKIILHGRTQPECTLAQIYLLVASVEGPSHEGNHGGIRQIDSFVLRWAAASLIGMEPVQFCQQLAYGALPEVEFDLERLGFACHHQWGFPVPIAGQTARLHVNLQLNLHVSKIHTISRVRSIWGLVTSAPLQHPSAQHAVRKLGCPCWCLPSTTQRRMSFGHSDRWPSPAAHLSWCLRSGPRHALRLTLIHLFLERHAAVSYGHLVKLAALLYQRGV